MDFKEKTDHIEKIANDPDAISSMIENHIHGIGHNLPNISQGVGTTLTNGIGYLNSKIPRPNGKMPLDQEFKPSDAAKQKFERHFDAVDKPVDVMRQIKDGTLSSEAMEALQSVHPQLLQHMRNRIKAAISPDVAKDLPHHVKKGLTQFLGEPLQSSDNMAVKVANQTAIAQPAPMPSQQRMSKKSPSTLGGLSKLELSKRAATQPDRQESSGD